MSEWLRPGILAIASLLLVIFGIGGAAVWPGPFPSILVPVGIVGLLLAKAWMDEGTRP